MGLGRDHLPVEANRLIRIKRDSPEVPAEISDRSMRFREEPEDALKTPMLQLGGHDSTAWPKRSNQPQQMPTGKGVNPNFVSTATFRAKVVAILTSTSGN